jgi:subfamily B ATP-binding cassette protein HlyB/CyaB
VGDTVARVRELETIRQFITGASINTMLDLPFIVLFIAVMFLYSTTLTFVVLCALPVFAGLSLFIRPLMRDAHYRSPKVFMSLIFLQSFIERVQSLRM